MNTPLKTPETFKDIDWVREQVKAELIDLKKEVNSFINENGEYDTSLVKEYLESIKDKSSSQLKEKNTSAWIMAVQIALDKLGYYENISGSKKRIDGILGDQTQEVVRNFQRNVGNIAIDGDPGPDTIQEILKKLATIDNTGIETVDDKLAKILKNIDRDELIIRDEEAMTITIKDGIEKEDGQGTYLEIEGLKFYKDAEDGLGYRKQINSNNNKEFICIGNYENDQKNGQGTHIRPDGSKYIGNWENDKRKGKGIYIRANRSKYIGNWENDQRNGQGTYIRPNGSKYIGNWENDKRKGKGNMYQSNGDRYVGLWENNLMHGEGVFRRSSGMQYGGYFKNDRLNGRGYLAVKKDGKVFTYDGTWEDGKLIDILLLTEKRLHLDSPKTPKDLYKLDNPLKLKGKKIDKLQSEN